MAERAGKLAIRAVNQYRRRDSFAFLSLRYCLDASAARSDHWVKKVAVPLVRNRTSSPYFRAQHFKEVDERGAINHRAMFIPGAAESLAEAALLSECARRRDVFGNLPCVFSYDLAEEKSTVGFYVPYFTGLVRRQAAIAEACREFPHGVVRYGDIRRCYPMLRIEHARSAWASHAERAQLTPTFRELGEKLIADYGIASGQGIEALLTGPMFSHLLANLVLKSLDEEVSTQRVVRYFRYVDDIVLVGDSGATLREMNRVRERLASLGLELHDTNSPKNMAVPCSAWLAAENDFKKEQRRPSWMTLIGSLKQLLLRDADQRQNLEERLAAAGVRIPTRDYSAVVREVSYSQRIKRWARFSWFRRRVQSITPEQILRDALQLRERYEEGFWDAFEGAAALKGFERKRRLPKLRYYASRLIYLASEKTLAEVADATSDISELFFHTELLRTVSDGNIDRILRMGTNAAQAAAQPLRAARRTTSCNTSVSPDTAKSQSLAIFYMNGVDVRGSASGDQSPLLYFSKHGPNISHFGSDTEPFLREIACLHGVAGQPRHAAMFERAFDADEAITMDAIDQLQQSVSP